MTEYIAKARTLYKIKDIQLMGGSLEDAYKTIEDIPAADVQPVVRCGECKYWYDECCCSEDALLRDRNFFCAYGGRAE